MSPLTRSVLVTGAGSGIGRATALLLAEHGWRVGAYDLTTPDLSAPDLPTNIHCGRLDVTSSDDWRAALDEFTASTGGVLDALVNNAGIIGSGSFAEQDVDAHLAIVAVNVGGVIRGSRLAYPYLQRAEHGHLVNMASASAMYGQPGLAVYGATKSAVKSLTEALDIEWRGDGITVTALWPLFVSTPMMDEIDELQTARKLGVRLTPNDVAQQVLRALTRRRLLGSPHVMVGAQAKLAGPLTRMTPPWVNRQVIGWLSR